MLCRCARVSSRHHRVRIGDKEDLLSTFKNWEARGCTENKNQLLLLFPEVPVCIVDELALVIPALPCGCSVLVLQRWL